MVAPSGPRRISDPEAKSVKRKQYDCWAEVMVDMEGGSQPSDRAGNRYTMTYICLLCHGVLLEPGPDLTHSAVRRMLPRCMFRSGRIPQILRTDRGMEFRAVLMQEFIALFRIWHMFGMPWRPVEQGTVERVHQELQKILGILLMDVTRAHREDWTELLPVVEYLLYTTPGPHGYTPRDLDRQWSLATPLERELHHMEAYEFEPISEYARNLFRAYRDLRVRIAGWQAETSEKRAGLANRFRRSKEVQVGDRVLYKDPRQKAAGGRTPWKEQLSGPWEVIGANGNRLKLRKEDDKSEIDAHTEDVVTVPTGARETERPITFEESREEARGSLPGTMHRSIGESIEAPVEKPQGKLEKLKLTVGGYVAYAAGPREEKRCTIGRIWSLDWGLRLSSRTPART